MDQDPAAVRWLDPPEERAWRAFMAMTRRLDVALARQLANDGLSLSDYAVLVWLTDRPDGRLRLFELAEGLGWERSRLSHQITRMAQRGLVTKEICPTDRRGAIVAVTASGSAAIEQAAPGHVTTVRQLFIDPLSADQLAALTDIADTVLATLEDHA